MNYVLNKTKAFAAAAAVSVALLAPVAASAATATSSVTASPSRAAAAYDWFTTTVDGTYSFEFAWTNVVAKSVAALMSVAIYNETTGDLVTSLGYSATADGATGSKSSLVSLAAGDYVLALTDTGYKATQLTASVTAVPGPIAGAGLPVLLGLAGYGLWRRREKAAA